MKKLLLVICLSMSSVFSWAQNLTVTPESFSTPFDFGGTLIETSVQDTFRLTTTSSTPVTVSYIWGSAGLGVSTCYKNTLIFEVVSISSSISNSSPGEVIVKFNPRAYNTYKSVSGSCVKTGTLTGVGTYVGDLQLSMDNTYVTTINLRGNGVDIINSIDTPLSENKLFPNPFTDLLNLEHSQAWEMYNVSGIKLKSGVSDKITSSDLPQGFYFVKLENGSITRVVKN